MKQIIVAALAAIGLSTAAQAQAWEPQSPITLMIAFAAGGGADTQARLIAEDLEARTGWSIIPEQRTGQSGLTLVQALQGAPKDGTAIGMVVSETVGYNMLVSDSGLTLADVTPLATTARFQMGIVAKAERGWTTLDDALDAAKAGETLRFGVMGDRLADIAFLLGEANGVEFNIVQVRGGAAVLNGIKAGDMDIGFAAGAQSRDVAAGTLVNLATGTPVPLAQTPDAPFITEFGIDFHADGFFIFVGPPGMDRAAADRIASEIRAIAEDPATKGGGLLRKAFAGASVMTGDALAAYLADEAAAAEALLKAVQGN